MSINKWILIGPVSPPITGPGVKNRNLIRELRKRSIDIKVLNTLKSLSDIIMNITEIFIGTIINRAPFFIILSVSTRGRYIFLPFIYLMNILGETRSILIPMGGSLDIDIEQLFSPLRKFYIKTLQEMDRIYPETEDLTSNIKKLVEKDGTVKKLYNFKRRPSKNPTEAKNYYLPYLKIVYLGRIKRSKGIIELIEAANILERKGVNFRLDFYGGFLFKDNFQKLFLSEIQNNDNIKYLGIIEPKAIPETLKNYHVFVFPSKRTRGEGFPGVIIDAFFSGLPVITSSAWKYRKEIILEGLNGFTYTSEDYKDLANKIAVLAKNRELLRKMSKKTWELSIDYDADIVVDGLLKELKSIKWI